jgi:hypothetical protein
MKKANDILQYKRARDMALLFKKHADSYKPFWDIAPSDMKECPVTLPEETIFSVAKDLNEAGFTLSEISQFDEKPYYFIMDTKKVGEIHWFMRRFRNSGGWKHIK